MKNRNINELKAGALLSYVNLGISCIVPMFYTPIMLSILGQGEYGLFSLSNSVITYLSLLNFGMGSAVMRYVTKARAEERKDEVEKVVGTFTIIYFILAILVIAIGLVLTTFSDDFFAKGLTQDEIGKLRILMIIMTFSTAISFPASVYSSVLVSYEKYLFRRILDIAGTLLTPVLNLIVLFVGCGSIGLALVGLFIQIVFAPIYIGYCVKSLKIKPTFSKLDKMLLKDIFSFSAFVFLSMIVDMMYWATDKILIGAMVGSVAVAIYNVGGVFTSILQNMSSAISNVFTPRVTSMVILQSSMEKLTDLLIRIGRLQYLIVSLILSGYIVFGQNFINVWAGKEYSDSYVISLLVMLPLSIPLIQNIAYNTILAQKKHQFRAIIYAIVAVANVIATFLVIPYFGIIGAAACSGIAYFIGNGLVMNIYYYKVTKLNIPKFWKNILRMSIVPLILGVIGYFVANYFVICDSYGMLAIQILIYTALFIGLSWLFTMNDYEKDIFKGMLTKIMRKKSSDNTEK